MQFNELSLREEILRAVAELGFDEATAIQSGAIPPILAGKDVMGRSSTGTGKTAAFGIPVVQMAADCADRASVLILSPTRELAVQTAGEIRKFAKYLPGVSTAIVFGGQPMDIQIRALKTAKIVIGTPGRIMDHLRRKTLKLEHLKTVILDEADEMLNMGFIDDIRTILESAPEDRQTVLFSATMPRAILQITQDFQKEPVMVAVDGGAKTVESIDQSYYNIPQGGKNDALKLLLEFHRPKRALVFCNTKSMVDELVADLNAAGFRSAGIHGDLKQSQRTAVMADFKSGRNNILIATDVAARGIDVEDIEAVFNYDIPQEYEYYIHRIGRTGRAGKKGASYTLAANRAQLMRVREIERYIKTPIEAREVPSIESISAHGFATFADEIRKGVLEQSGYEWKKFVDDLVKEGVDAADIAAVLCGRLQNKNKRLAAVHNVRSITATSGQRGTGAGTTSAGRAWISVSIGSDAKIGPNFIVGAIVEGTGLSASDIGKINIYADHTEIDLSKENADKVIAEMPKGKIKQQEVTYTRIASKAVFAHHAGGEYKGKKPSYGSKPRDRFAKGRKPHDAGKYHKD
ncbi:MAG: DEAD/DEAH box helicase [Ruthenibacterium sp.]